MTMSNREKAELGENNGEERYQEWLNQPFITHKNETLVDKVLEVHVSMVRSYNSFLITWSREILNFLI